MQGLIMAGETGWKIFKIVAKISRITGNIYVTGEKTSGADEIIPEIKTNTRI